MLQELIFEGKKYLLAYSGGPDSKALLYHLLSFQKKRPFTLLIAHVDHSWRKTSSQEAKEIEEEAKALSLPFFLKTIEKGSEEEAREKRYAFFEEIYQEEGCCGLFLGHHKDDLAETVLKRVLEGAHLSSLYGMTPAQKRGGMLLLRPFLEVEKKEILAFLEDNQLLYIQDATNLDPHFLRGRMRKEILPYLRDAFGKEIVSNLALLSKRSSGFKEELDRKIEGAFEMEGPFGKGISLKDLTPLEKEHLIRKKAREEKVFLSREEIVLLLQKESLFLPNHVGRYRDWLFFLKPISLSLPRTLQEGSMISGEYQIEVTREPKGKESSWEELFQGKGEFFLPSLEVKWGENKKRLSQKGIPPFLRQYMTASKREKEGFWISIMISPLLAEACYSE